MEVTPVEWFINGGVALVVLALVLTGVLVPGWVYKKEEKARENAEGAVALERARNAGLEQMAATGTKAMRALAEVAEENRRALRDDSHAAALREDLRREHTPPEGIPQVGSLP